MVILILVLAISANAVLAASDGSRIPLLAEDTELHVAEPLAVTPVISRAFDLGLSQSGTSTVYSGQQIGEIVVRVENRSPLDQSAHIWVTPRKWLKGWSNFDLNVWEGDTVFDKYRIIPAGVTVELRIEVFISYGGSTSSFQGLDLHIDAASPPTQEVLDHEIIEGECPKNGCG